jgi:hypothetical protein
VSKSRTGTFHNRSAAASWIVPRTTFSHYQWGSSRSSYVSYAAPAVAEACVPVKVAGGQKLTMMYLFANIVEVLRRCTVDFLRFR